MIRLPRVLVEFRTALEEAIGREQAARARRSRHRRRIAALAVAAAAVVIVGTASGVTTVREFFFVENEKHERVSRTVDGIRFSLSVPRPSWEDGPIERINGKFRNHGLFISKSSVGPQGAEAVIFWAGLSAVRKTKPCAEALTSAADRSRTELATALANAPGTKLAGGPWETGVGGHPATRVVLRVKKDLGCQPGFFFSWPYSECWGACWDRTDVGDSIRLWIVDVAKKRLFFVAVTKPGHRVEQEIGDIKRSIRFG